MIKIKDILPPRIFFSLVLCFVFSFSASSAPLPPSNATIHAKLLRGINILGYDGIWSKRNNTKFDLDRFRLIKDAGFTHVRINLFAFLYQDEGYKQSELWLNVLDDVLSMAQKSGLFVVVDVHDFQFCQKKTSECLARLTPFWKTIAERYKGRSADLAYDLLNEPGGGLTPEIWGLTVSNLIQLVRGVDPDVYILISFPGGGSHLMAERLVLPEEIGGLVAEFHYYQPMPFTHQGARWISSLKDISGVTWGSDKDYERIEKDFSFVESWANSKSIPIYLGEFGVYDAAPVESKVRYLKEVVRQAEKRGWGWAYWQFDHDFSAFDELRGQWNADVVDSIIHR